MSTSVSSVVVVGNDGVAPIYQPNGRWCWWSINEIYMGPNSPGQNKYVPKVNDYVIDPSVYVVYVVEAVDPVALTSTLVEIMPPFIATEFTPPDVLFGVGPGTQSDTYRVYLDTSVTPYILAVDIRLRVAGTKASYCKIFLGSVVDNTGTVISMVYDNSGNFVSQNVPLELVGIDNVTNYSIKTVSVCNTNLEIIDGEIVTAVIYDDQGNVVSKRQLLVENTSFIRSVNVSQKYVTGIALKSPFLSAIAPSTIDFPLNLPINALNLTGIVNYSDGSSLEMPVDGTKFSIIGLGQYVSTIVGQVLPLVLSYQLGPEEVAYGAVNLNTRYVTEPYNIQTIDADNSYSVKIYGYPEWGGANGYSMRWYLFNLDRNIFFDVTPYVTFSQNTGTFNPTQYGYLQRKAVQLNLSQVSGTFNPYIATQLLDISLLEAPNGLTTPWTVSQVSGSDIPAYGNNLVATITSSTGNTLVNISAGITDFNTWLQQVYNQTFPLLNANETTPPAPTHFALMYMGNEVIYPIANWNQSLAVSGAFTNYSNVYIRFINRTASGDQQLSIAGMLIYQTS